MNGPSGRPHGGRHRRWMLLGMAVFGMLFLGANDSDLYLRIHKSIELFGKVYKEIALHHVDDIQPERLMRSGVDGMLQSVDPYTVFLEENEKDEIDLVTTGRYGGIGVSIGIRDGEITIVNLLEGYSASKQGLQVGDRILAVDGTILKDMAMEEVRKLVRGAPGTEVRFTVERTGVKAALEFLLVREDIPVKNITYAGFVEPGIAYIRVERFSRTAANDLRTHLKDLQAREAIQGIVLDLRDNPGGLLDIAVDMVAKFVPESSLVVSTRGRRPESERRYHSLERPMFPTVPLAVLVNENSASASEIVAGAIQDLDRGVVVGTRTFGKGLVQTISRLTETASMKVTTARYYTPSGRCIQELDYAHRKGNGDASSVPDSLRQEFRTANGRRVFEAGGIAPDTLVRYSPPGSLMTALQRRAMFFKFANHLVAENRITDAFVVTDRTVEDFERYLQATRFSYDEDMERVLRDLESRAALNKYTSVFADKLAELTSVHRTEKERSFDRHREDIRLALGDEIRGRVGGERARVEAMLSHDIQAMAAVGILKDRRTYGRLTSP